MTPNIFFFIFKVLKLTVSKVKNDFSINYNKLHHFSVKVLTLLGEHTWGDPESFESKRVQFDVVKQDIICKLPLTHKNEKLLTS